MSNICAVCGKHPEMGHNVSHSNKKTGRVFKPNILKTEWNIRARSKILIYVPNALKQEK